MRLSPGPQERLIAAVLAPVVVATVGVAGSWLGWWWPILPERTWLVVAVLGTLPVACIVWGIWPTIRLQAGHDRDEEALQQVVNRAEETAAAAAQVLEKAAAMVMSSSKPGAGADSGEAGARMEAPSPQEP